MSEIRTKGMPDFMERVKHYETKCRQHLSRVRLSHVLALGALRWEQVRSDQKYGDLIRSSLGNETQDVFEAKLRTVLHELHLVSLKANFELFLNRLLSTVWTFHFAELATSISGDERVSLRELGDSFVNVTVSSVSVSSTSIIDKIVPEYGLPRFITLMKKATQINLPDVLKRKDSRYWPQICTAFEVRHLAEHNDGKVNKKFRAKLVGLWQRSTWGKREPSLERLEKVVVEEEDVIETYTAMLDATCLLTEEVLRWSSGQAGGQSTHEKPLPVER